MRTRWLVLTLVLLGGAIVAPNIATAHDLRAVVTVDSRLLRVEAGFDDDTPAQQAEITITQADGTVIATGRTDERGVWSCPRPAPGRYTAKVHAIGHVDTVEFEVKVPRPLLAQLSDTLGTSAENPGSPPNVESTIYTRWRFNKTYGLILGVVALLGLSGAYWWFRRRNRLP